MAIVCFVMHNRIRARLRSSSRRSTRSTEDPGSPSAKSPAPRSPAPRSPAPSSPGFGGGNWTSRRPWSWQRDVLLPLLFALYSAQFGSMMVVQSKAVSMLFVVSSCTGGAVNIWATFYFWMTCTLLGVLGFTWMYKMNEALGLYDPLYIIPLLQAMYISLGVVASGIFFGEFDKLAPWRFILFVSGIGIVLLGIYLIAPREADKARSRTAPRTPNANERPRHETPGLASSIKASKAKGASPAAGGPEGPAGAAGDVESGSASETTTHDEGPYTISAHSACAAKRTSSSSDGSGSDPSPKDVLSL